MIRTREWDGVVYLEVPEPVALGEQSTVLAQELVDVCIAIDERDEPLTAVVLQSGVRGFWLEQPRNAVDCDLASRAWSEAGAALNRLSPPVIAVIGGDAIGPAWELALACDLRLIAAEAKVGSPEIHWGRIPAGGGTQRLTRVVSQATALRLLLLGVVLPAAVALEMGLVHLVAPADELERVVEEMLVGLRGSAPLALAYVREAIRGGADQSLAAGLRLETDLAILLHSTRDRAEGIGAFLDRRAPRFEGR